MSLLAILAGPPDLHHPAPVAHASHLDDDVDGVRKIAQDVVEAEARAGCEDEEGEALHGLAGSFGMDGGEGSGMAGVDRVEEGCGLGSPEFAEDDPVGPEAQGGLEEEIGGPV